MNITHVDKIVFKLRIRDDWTGLIEVNSTQKVLIEDLNFTRGVWYDGYVYLTTVDEQSGEISCESYLVKDNRDEWRIIPHEVFITIDNWRSEQLKKLD